MRSALCSYDVDVDEMAMKPMIVLFIVSFPFKQKMLEKQKFTGTINL